MPTVDIYSKQQVDALIAGAGGLPDPTSASAGDVLTLDSNKDPAWTTPSTAPFENVYTGNIASLISKSGNTITVNRTFMIKYYWWSSATFFYSGTAIIPKGTYNYGAAVNGYLGYVNIDSTTVKITGIKTSTNTVVIQGYDNATQQTDISNLPHSANSYYFVLFV